MADKGEEDNKVMLFLKIEVYSKKPLWILLSDSSLLAPF